MVTALLSMNTLESAHATSDTIYVIPVAATIRPPPTAMQCIDPTGQILFCCDSDIYAARC